MAFPIPVYIAAGVGFTTCMRVWRGQFPLLRYESMYAQTDLEEIDRIHHGVFLSKCKW